MMKFYVKFWMLEVLKMRNIIFAINILNIESHLHEHSSINMTNINIAEHFIQNTIEKKEDVFHEQTHRIREECKEVLPLDGSHSVIEKDENGIVTNWGYGRN